MAAFPNVMDDASVTNEQHSFMSAETTRLALFSQQAARLNSFDTFLDAQAKALIMNNLTLLQTLAQDMQLGRESPEANTGMAMRFPYGPLPIPPSSPVLIPSTTVAPASPKTA